MRWKADTYIGDVPVAKSLRILEERLFSVGLTSRPAPGVIQVVVEPGNGNGALV